MSRKIYYINDMPFSLAYGGKEVQLLGYKGIIEASRLGASVNLLDPWQRFNFPSDSVMHFFGSGKWFHNLLSQARLKSEVNKLIISPTFYYDNPWKVKIGDYLSRFCPLENQFSYKRFIFDVAHTLVVNSRAEGDQITSIFGAHLRPKLKIIPNTIANDYSVLNDVDCFLLKYKLDPDYILSVGFLDERKNSLRLVESFLEVYPDIGKKLVLIGGNRFLSKIQSKLMDSLIRDNPQSIINIPFLPTSSDLIKSAYKNCAFHALPSHVETPGIANLEALAFDKQILVGDCLPVKEYFGDYAVYCDSGSKKSIKRAFFVANERSKINSNGILSNFLNKKFVHSVIMEDLISIYH